MTEYQDIERRLAEVEARVAVLECGGAPVRPPTPPSEKQQDASSIIRLVVTNKRYQPQDLSMDQYQDHIWFDCDFRAMELVRPARAIKGTVEFCDLFGEPRFRIGHTLNDPIAPGGSASVQGIGFEYNQFLSEHQWMLSTDLNDMTVRFSVAQILYKDGTVEKIV